MNKQPTYKHVSKLYHYDTKRFIGKGGALFLLTNDEVRIENDFYRVKDFNISFSDTEIIYNYYLKKFIDYKE